MLETDGMMRAFLRRWARRSSRPLNAKRLRSIHLEPLEPRLAFHLGELDPSFGAGGIVETPFSTHLTSSDLVADVAVGPHDEIVEVGRSIVNRFLLGITKRLADGSVDTSFGEGGQVLEPFADFGGDGGRVAIQPDGKIVVAAERNVGRLVVARYETDGRRDTSFGVDGLFDVQLGAGFTAGDVMVQPDGAIVVVGAVNVGAVGGYVVTDTAAVRIQGNGQLDSSFGDAGVVQFSLHDFREGAQHVARQEDGKLVLVGSTHDLPGQRQIFAARLDEHGVLDDQFAVGGVRLLSYGRVPMIEESADVSVVVQASGRLILSATRETQAGVDDFNLLAITSAGDLDLSFGADGILTTTFAGRADAQVRELIQRPDGRLLAVGGSISNVEDLLLVQYQANGSLDPTWGQSGISIVTNVARGAAVALQSQARAIVTHKALDVNGRFDFGAIGIQATGAVDSTFGSLGRVQTNIAADFSNAEAATLVVQGDGKVVAAGNCQSEDGLPWCIARYQGDGTLDPAFGVGGKLVAGPKFSYSSPLLLLAPDGGLVAVAQSNNSEGVLHLERFDRHGRLDSTWGVQGVRDVELSEHDLFATQAMLQSDGKILVAANLYAADSTASIQLFRLNADGTLDVSFGVQGSLMLNGGWHDLGLDNFSTMFLDTAGRITVVLTKDDDQGPEIVVTRYLAAGQLDAAWGVGGETIIPAGHDVASCGAGAYLSDGDLLFACNVDGASPWFVRLDDQGRLVESFGDQGILTNPGITSDVGGGIRSLVAAPHGGWAAVGWGFAPHSSAQTQALVQYFLDDGSLDANAGDAGLLWIDRDPAGSRLSAGALGPDGDLYVAGRTAAMIDSKFLVAKIQGDGALYRPWHLTTNPLKVSGDAQVAVAPIDALLVINELNGPGSRRLAAPLPNVQPHAFIDVNRDGFVSPIDALLVINHLNDLVFGEGEWQAEAPSLSESHERGDRRVPVDGGARGDDGAPMDDRSRAVWQAALAEESSNGQRRRSGTRLRRLR